MRYLILVSLIGLGLSLIAFGLAGTLATASRHSIHTQPAALLLSLDNRLHAFRSAATELLRVWSTNSPPHTASDSDARAPRSSCPIAAANARCPDCRCSPRHGAALRLGPLGD